MCDGFDAVWISVGTPEQKLIYEALIPSLRETVPAAYRVICDAEDGSRIGSGGAVLKVLRASADGGAGSGKALVILGGGLCRRTPNFALRGKALVPAGADADGAAASCLEAVLRQAAALAEKCDPGLLVCCTDILLDCAEIEGPVSQSTAFCVDAPAETGARHGVMFADGTGTLARYLQKAPAETLKQAAAVFGTGDAVPVDAGWFYFSRPFVGALASLARTLPGETPLNLFTDLLPACAGETAYDAFVAGGAAQTRALIWSALRAFPLRVVRSGQPFVHFGTSAEILDLLCGAATERRTALFNADCDPTVSVGGHTLLENVKLTGGARVGDGCLVTDIALEGVDIPDGTAVFGMRLRSGLYVAVVFPLESSADGAPETAARLWDRSVFYPERSFTRSCLRFLSAGDGAGPGGMPAEDCLRQADASFYLEWRQYLIDARRASDRIHPRYFAVKDRILQTYFADRAALAVLQCRKERVERELPVRVNFSGTWTDCMPYCIDHGGRVVNAPITVNGKRPIRICAERIPEKRIEMCNADVPGDAAVFSATDRASSPFSAHGLHRAVLQTLGIGPETELRHGLRLSVSVSGIMKGSGLGTSSILLYGCFSALGEWMGIPFTEEALLHSVFIAEQLMGTGGGWQDQGAVVGGGVKVVSAPPGLQQRISVIPVEAAPGFLQSLSERLVLIPTGRRHFGRFIVKDVMSRYLTGENREVFPELETLNSPLIQSIHNGNMSQFAGIINAHSECLMRLSPLIYGEDLPALREKCLRYTDACCICGAGGGGYLAALRKPEIPLREMEKILQTEILDAALILD